MQRIANASRLAPGAIAAAGGVCNTGAAAGRRTEKWESVT
eukprot:gene42747-53036_t